MEKKIKDLIPIREITDDFNLFIFNNNLLSTEGMIDNKLMEAIANVKIQIVDSN